MENYCGKRLDGRYEIREIIGVGGMAVVYKAYDVIDDRIVAIKILKEEFLVPLGISQYRLAKETGIPAQRIGQIILGRRRVTADTDLRLCRYFGLTDGYWLRAQMAFDLEAEKRRIEPELDKIVPVQRAVAL